MMAALAALMQAQAMALQQANKAMYVRRKRKRKAIQSDHALSVSEVQAMVDQNYVETEIREEMPRPKKRISRCSRCRNKDHNARTCRL
jgi:hypothetical protein